MFKIRSSPITYHCINDCREEGCPGHELRLVWNLSTDDLEENCDGELVEVYDEHRFTALMKAGEEILGCYKSIK